MDKNLEAKEHLDRAIRLFLLGFDEAFSNADCMINIIKILNKRLKMLIEAEDVNLG